MPAFRSVAALAMALVALSACKGKPAAPPAPVAPPSSGPTPPRVNQDSINRAKAFADSIENARRMMEEANRNRGAIAEARAALTRTIYFDYDKDEIRDDQRAALDAKVPILNNNPALRLRIAGHTDNRGSDEYNLALGQRRSASAKRYLVSRGIAESRLDVVSFGEERPAAQGDNEDSWAKNRRDEFEIVAGGDNIRVRP